MNKAWGIPIVVLAFASALAGQTATINLEAVQGPVMGNVYTSPYYGTVNSNPALVPIICDDFFDESYLPETWTAYDTSLSGLATGNEKWTSGTVPGSSTLNQSQAYTTAAYLAVEILDTNQSTSAGAEQAGDLSYAMWALFDPVVFTDQTNGSGGSCTLPGGFGCLSTADYNAAVADLQSAWNAVQTMGLTPTNFDSKMGVEAVTIYTYDSNAGLPTGCNGTCPPPPQEFISVTTPEATTPVLLAVDLFGFMALVVFLRKRMPRSI
jgi:hypothetical protein